MKYGRLPAAFLATPKIHIALAEDNLMITVF
jgi:hypothetical protein